jgi:hypothetical protein
MGNSALDEELSFEQLTAWSKEASAPRELLQKLRATPGGCRLGSLSLLFLFHTANRRSSDLDKGY